MNSKLLFAATVAVSLISTLALADEAQLTRAQVNADLNQAIATHTLQRTDYDSTPNNAVVSSNRTRADVAADLASAKAARKALKGPDANRTYNPYGTEILAARSTLTRDEVKTEVRQAAAAGTLQRTDYDDASLVARRANQHAAPSTLAQRVKAVFTRGES